MGLYGLYDTKFAPAIYFFRLSFAYKITTFIAAAAASTTNVTKTAIISNPTLKLLLLSPLLTFSSSASRSC